MDCSARGFPLLFSELAGGPISEPAQASPSRRGHWHVGWPGAARVPSS